MFARSLPNSRHLTRNYPFISRDIASKGGKVSSGSFEPGSQKASEAGKKGGLS